MKTRFLKWSILLVAIFAVIPYMFTKYPDYRFSWNMLMVLLICFIVGDWILKRKNRYGGYIVWALLSIVMANKWFSYQELLITFPVLSGISGTAALGAGALLVILSAFCTGVYNMCHTKIAKRKDRWNSTPYVKAGIRTKQRMEEGNIAEKTGISLLNYETFKVNEENVEYVPQIKIRVIIGSVAAVMAIVALGGLITIAAFQNRDILKQIDSKELLQILLDAAILLMATFMAICSVIMIILAFIKSFIRVLQDMVWRKRGIDTENSFILGCVSILLTGFFYIFFRKATMQDFYEMINGGTEAIALLAFVVTLIMLVMTYHMTYRLLSSCLRKEGLVHQYSDEILHLLAKTVMELLKKLTETVTKVPDLYDMLLAGGEKAGHSLVQLLFEDEEDEE
ncbi:MAG: hypothetical protein HFG42_04185 [Lachnospiraceae bacterium]|nr:hypothetical protein [Lachnospiraceae bacterium]